MYTHIHTHTLPPLFCPAGAIHRKCRHTPGVSAAYHLHRFGRVQAEGVHFCYTLSMVFRCTLLHFCYTLSMVCRCTLFNYVTSCQVHTFAPDRCTLLHFCYTLSMVFRCTFLHFCYTLSGAHFYTSITPCHWCSGAHFYRNHQVPCVARH